MMPAAGRKFAGAGKFELCVIMCGMFGRFNKVLVAFTIAAVLGGACSKGEGEPAAANTANSQTAESAKAPATPSNQITEADVAKLKWLEGTWRGMDGEKPFFERIHFEGSTMIVETLTDETASKVSETSRFELKDGEFGHTKGDQRSAASSITDNSVQFVPAAAQPAAPAKGNTFRFERQPDGTFRAVLEIPAKGGRPAGEKVYKMEPWKAPAK
jgi:hypothetical protein